MRSDVTGPTIVIPAKSSNARYLGGLFLLFWLGGWVFGFKSALSQVIDGKGGFFLIFWLGGWTVGGVLAAVAVYRIFRPSIPETLQLTRNGVDYDAGIPPFEFNTYKQSAKKEYWNSLFAKRTRVSFDRQQMQTVRLRETETGNRLTIDLGSQRLELASQASEVEREWLARLLERRYAIASLSAKPAGEV
ncbi:MAG: hypothetical protein DI543_12710 [Bradyrhizobium icense]|nr:MAG: hypothetical protein DI543_12710 [Bradyrhizobium icense]